VRVLVTGAGGFVGGFLLSELRRSGHDTVPVYSPSATTADGLNLLDAERTIRRIDETCPDAIVHLAARSKPATMEALRSLVDENLTMAANVLEASRVAAPRARVILASSSAVYGAVPIERNPIKEDEPYGAAKAAVEALASVYVALGIDVVVARSFNLVGPGQDPSFAIPSFARQVALASNSTAEHVIETGPLDKTRDFTDVRDAVAAYLLLIARSPPPGLYNVCSGVARCLRDVLEDLMKQAGIRAVVREAPDRGSGGQLDVPYQCGSRALIGRVIGWQPTIPWEETLSDILADWQLRTHAGEVT